MSYSPSPKEAFLQYRHLHHLLLATRSPGFIVPELLAVLLVLSAQIGSFCSSRKCLFGLEVSAYVIPPHVIQSFLKYSHRRHLVRLDREGLIFLVLLGLLLIFSVQFGSFL